jgi:hypothetical protein
MAAGSTSFGVSGMIFSRKSSDAGDEMMHLLLPETRKADKGRSSGSEADAEGSDCRCVASTGNRGRLPGTLEVSGASLSRRSSSDSSETCTEKSRRQRTDSEDMVRKKMME